MARSMIDPNKLVFREEIRDKWFVQTSAEDLQTEGPGSGEYLSTIVTVKTGSRYEIIDGHHRARAAQIAGEKVPMVSIGEKCYKELKAKDFDDMEIAYAVLSHYKEYEAADNLASQFGMRKRGDQAEKAMEETCG